MRAGRPELLLIDNVDSFTFMLADCLMQAGADVAVVRNDSLSVEEALERGRDGIVASPGPGTPEDAGVSIDVARACVTRLRTFLGVCLGHQALALAFGSVVGRTDPIHGKTADVRHDGSGLFSGLSSPFAATRYHSLAVTETRPPLIANAWSRDGIVMGIRHESAPAHGVQFHPESVASEQGLAILSAFVKTCQPPA